MKKNRNGNWLGVGLVFFLAWFLGALPAFALNQLVDSDTMAAGSWAYRQNPPGGNNRSLSTLAQAGTGNPSPSAYGVYNSNGANRGADGIVEQVYTNGVYPVRANIRLQHIDYRNGSFDRNQLIGTIRVFGTGTYPNETLVTTFFNEDINEAGAIHTVWQNTGWVGPINLDASTGYICRVFFNMVGDNGESGGAYIDNFQLNTSPANLRASFSGTQVDLSWQASTGSPGLLEYRVYRSTTSGGPYTQITTRTTNSYTDPAPPAANVIYYVVTDVDTNGDESPYSFEGMAFKLNVNDGPGPDIAYTLLSDRYEGNWEHPDAPLMGYTAGLGTSQGVNNVVSPTDVGLANNVLFTGLSLASGTKYFLNLTAYDTNHITQAPGFSDGVTVIGDQVLTDTASQTYFHNARELAMVDTSTDQNSIRPQVFGAGGLWRFRCPVTVTEPGVTDRVNAPFRIQFNIAVAGQRPLNVNEIRAGDDAGIEIPRYNLPTSTTTNPDVVILVNMRRGETKTYYLSWGNTGVGDPAGNYNWVTQATDISTVQWSPYYTRKYLPAGDETDMTITLARNFGYNAGVDFERAGNYGAYRDDAQSDAFNIDTLLGITDFYFYGNIVNSWRTGSNGVMFNASSDYGDYSNTWNEFTGATARWTNLIAPLWVDLKYDNVNYPQNPGVYGKNEVLTNPTRMVFTWRTNRYTYEDDIYIFQVVAYATNDIAIRYEFLSPRAVIGPAGTYDDPVNTVNTVGLSRGNNTFWNRSTPLNIGIGQTPTSFFQCMDAFRGLYTVGTIEGAAAGFVGVSQIDSMVFDSRSSSPDWVSLNYDCTLTANGRLVFSARTGTTDDPSGWGAWTTLGTVTVTGAGTLAIPVGVADSRYIQYRCVFQRDNAAGALPILNQVQFIARGFSIDSVVADTPSGVSQGQQGIPVQVTYRNFHINPLRLDSTALTFSLGNYTQVLDSPTLPAIIPVGGTLIATFLVDVADASAVGTATIHAIATATDVGLGLTFSDLDAQDPHVWLVKTKSNLVITLAETVPVYVNKGQNGIGVRLFIENTGQTSASFDGASLTFSLGDYSWYLSSPASDSSVIIPGAGSITATFSVNILPTSPSGVAIISGTASGTNTLSNKITEGLTAQLTDSWTIQTAASLVLDTVTASDTVYRGQTNVPVGLEVFNLGEAKANWGSSTLKFTLGTYDAVYPLDTLPMEILGGLSRRASYGVDISPISATGTSKVDADVFGKDGNTAFDISCIGALNPATWTIKAEQVKTYKDASFLYPSASFNRPDSGFNFVYAKGENLAPFKEYSIRWYDPLNNEVASTNPPLTSDASGTLSHQYGLTSASSYGTWKVKITNPVNTIIACETGFDVVSGASLSVQISLPTTVSVGQPFVGSMTFINVGGAAINSAYPGTLATGGTGVANFINGPNPTFLDLTGYGQATTTWTWAAQTAGTFIATGTGYGFDANSDQFLTAASATSNVCTIQTGPNVTVLSVVATPTLVYRNQNDLMIQVTLRNSGQATANLTAASLTFTIGSFTQSIATPTLPFALAGNNTQVAFNFDIAVASLSPTGLSAFSGNFVYHDANFPASQTVINAAAPNDSWTVASVGLVLSRDVSYSPEQYAFNRGQQLYVRAFGLTPAAQWFRIRLYSSEIPNTSPAPLGWVTVSPLLAADANGYADFLYSLPAGAVLGRWSAEVEEDPDLNSGTRNNLLAVQYFSVEDPGNLVATLSLSPTSVFVDETITATLGVKNTVPSGSTLSPATSATLVKTPATIGDATMLTGPDPASMSVSPTTPGTFTWTFQATADTGLVGSYSLYTTVANSVTGIDSNSGNAAGSNQVLSNSVFIYRRGVEVSSAVIDLGTYGPGDTPSVLGFTASNTANYNLANVRWNATNLNGPNASQINKVNLSFSPVSGFTLNSGVKKLASATLFIPFNQSAGTYIATMSIFEDLNGNSSQDFGEPYDLFNVQTLVASQKKIYIVENSLDLGDWEIGQTTATKTISFFNGGNLDLNFLRFKQDAAATNTFPITFDPINPGVLGTDVVRLASISASISVGPTGTYVATWTLFEDANWNNTIDAGEASDSVLVRVGVGGKTFTLAPDPIDAGVGTPSYVIGGLSLTLTNTGGLPLSALKTNFQPLADGLGNFIASDNIGLAPSPIPTVNPSLAGNFTLSLYVPPGTAVGIFSGTQWIYEDSNGNNGWDTGEASQSFLLTVDIPSYRAVQVMATTVDVGGIAPDTGRTVSFTCRNTGNVPLTNLGWVKNTLWSGSNSIAVGFVTFAALPLPISAGTIFSANITINVPAGQTQGTYVASTTPYYLYDDDGTIPGYDAADPQSNFSVQCQVGLQALDIVEAGITINNAVPNANTASESFQILNTGDLSLSTPKASATTDLIDGGNSIPATACRFTRPIGAILPSQTRVARWSVAVPANQPVGTYVGMVRVWDDADNDNIMDPAEASDTAVLTINVIEQRAIDVTPNVVDLLTVPPGSVGTASFVITNVGNKDISAGELILGLASEVLPLGVGSPIPASEVTFYPAGFLSNDLPIGSYTIATITLKIPAGQTDGLYEGQQRTYVDHDPINGSWQSSEATDLFTLRVLVGSKDFSFTDPVNFGSRNPGANYTMACTMTNLTTYPLNPMKLLKTALTSGANSIPTAQLNVPTLPTNLGSSEVKACIASITIPPFQIPGVYQGTQTVYEDINGNNALDVGEANKTFVLQVEVATYPILNILPAFIDLGMIQQGTTGGPVEIGYYNAGNATMSNLAWLGPDDIPHDTIVGEVISAPKVVFSAPGAVSPGQYATVTLALGPIDPAQTLGDYIGNQVMNDLALVGAYPTASDTFEIRCNIVPGVTGPALASGCVFQEIATVSFPIAPATGRFILSAWVCPGTGTARIGFFESKTDGTIVNTDYVQITSAGVLTSGGIHLVEVGSTVGNTMLNPLGEVSHWTRIYMAFDYGFDSTTADETYVLLQNPSAEGYAVWFDGVQLEKAAILSGQTRPTVFTPGKNLISPNTNPGPGGYPFWEY
jgi:hypothetical protein